MMQRSNNTKEPAKNAFRPKLTARQRSAFDALNRGDIREVLYGGAKGGGKSVFGCLWCFHKAIEIIKQCNIKPRKHPIPIGFMGRKRSVDFTNTTLESWKRFIPPDYYRIKGKPAEIIIADRVKILTGGLDNSDVIRKFNSAEYAFFFIDQAEEVDASQIGELRATFRLVINGVKVSGKGLFTANPAPSFLKDEFILDRTDDRLFIQALPSDNPFLGSDYIRILKDSFKNRPDLLRAYLEGSWEVLAGFDQVIKDQWVSKAQEITLNPDRLKKLITCDPARYGNDETVIYFMENTQIADRIIYGKKSLMHTANVIHTLARNNDNCLIILDECGLGAGLMDRLIEMGDDVFGVNYSGKSDEPQKYYNLRSQIWCTAADMFAECDIELKDIDPKLKSQLCSPVYEFRNGKVLIESKANIKKRLGTSPDRADAYVNGLYALQFIDGQILHRKRKYRDPFAECYEDDDYLGNHSFMAV